MQTLSQDPTAADFTQAPYPFYERARECGAMFHWQEYGLPCAVSYASVNAILRDRRFGREIPEEKATEKPAHQTGFWAIENHSMLELEPPRHTRLRGLVLRAFTSRRIKELAPEIASLSHDLIDKIPQERFDFIEGFAQPLPVIIIARLLGIPEENAPELLRWSNAIVGMYKAGRTYDDEVAASEAGKEFADFLRDYVAFRRDKPQDDLITHLIAAEEDGEKLSTDELIATCVLLLNAGHEATVHTLGNGLKAFLENGCAPDLLGPDAIEGTVEEMLRYDPPLHMFTRYAYEDIEVGRHSFKRGDQVACLLAAANRDPGRWEDPDHFLPERPKQVNASFGAGTHFCIGAPLARLEIQTALPILFERMPKLAIVEQPEYAPIYHFRGLKSLHLSA
ncbi:MULTISPECIES: cytochrome P450 [Halocynthiibacter]|uniref:Cytochrome P450 n=1 Tax=Halocynthiibacter halioticoli TaxID=2986804 RepID=A0AAE3LT73_9RHOB|nr:MULTISPECIES: cytochrome P450 [Halocynthiibacter]MCV6824636.1 cytochrome P450 [Halocynthiibacter halioticoli]MCW4057637.1 cytochrome P450 [Halocynthiibacter sp. SDUM655004]